MFELVWDGAAHQSVRENFSRPSGVCVIARWSSEKWTSDIESSREAAQECSPRRKPWVKSGTRASPNGAKEKLRHSLLRDSRISSTFPGAEAPGYWQTPLGLDSGRTQSTGSPKSEFSRTHFSAAITAWFEMRLQPLRSGCKSRKTFPAAPSHILGATAEALHISD